MGNSNGNGEGGVVRDSAVIITAATVLLFTWGYAFEAFRWTGASVPGMFQPEVTVQERALVGGIVALFMFLPAAIAVWAIDAGSRYRLRRWFWSRWRTGVAHQVVMTLVLFAASVALVRPFAVFFDRYGNRSRVEQLTLKSGGASPVTPGMYCAGKRGSAYVFVDTLEGSSRRVFVIPEEEIRALVLVYAPRSAE